MIDVFIGGLNCLVTAFADRAGTAVIRYNSDYLKLKVSHVVL